MRRVLAFYEWLGEFERKRPERVFVRVTRDLRYNGRVKTMNKLPKCWRLDDEGTM